MATKAIEQLDEKTQEQIINSMRFALESLRNSQPEMVERVLEGSPLNIATLKFEQRLAAYRGVFEALVGQGVLENFEDVVDATTNELLRQVGEA